MRQKKLADECGFGFVRFFPAGFKPNLAVAAWLLSIVDPSVPSMVHASGSVIPFEVSDVELMLGVRGGTLPVATAGVVVEDARAEVAKFLSISFPKKVLSVARCKSVLTKLHACSFLSLDLERAFVSALVLYTTSSVLAPLVERGGVQLDDAVIVSLREPLCVGGFDWPKYTLDRVTASAVYLQEQLRAKSNHSVLHVGGCYVFLLLFFFQKMSRYGSPDFETVKPMIRLFNCSKLRELEDAIIFDRAVLSQPRLTARDAVVDSFVLTGEHSKNIDDAVNVGMNNEMGPAGLLGVVAQEPSSVGWNEGIKFDETPGVRSCQFTGGNYANEVTIQSGPDVFVAGDGHLHLEVDGSVEAGAAKEVHESSVTGAPQFDVSPVVSTPTLHLNLRFDASI
ncbi:unnamed protein product [Urochloa humidicola]